VFIADDGVKRPGRAVERRDPQAAALEGGREGRALSGVAEELVDAEMRCRRLAAGRDLDARRTDARGDVEGGLEPEMGERVGVEAELQGRDLTEPAKRPV
jgi:hypothetical protein